MRENSPKITDIHPTAVLKMTKAGLPRLRVLSKIRKYPVESTRSVLKREDHENPGHGARDVSANYGPLRHLVDTVTGSKVF